MRRVKYNENFQDKTNERSRGMLYTKYHQQITALLAPSIDSYRYYGFEKLYVQQPLLECTKPYKRKSLTDNFIYITGTTGSGKTILLKATFGHIDNTIVYDTPNLIIPFSCDNMVGDMEQLRQRIASLYLGTINKICKDYDLKKFNEPENINDFIEYIEARRVQFSISQHDWREKKNEELIDELNKNDRLELALLAFKYTMKQEKCPFDNVVFIIDDIESVGPDNELRPVYISNKIFSCLNNRTKSEKEKWCCNVVVACRHYVWRIFSTRHRDHPDSGYLREANLTFGTMESFSYIEDFDLSDYKMPELSEIIHKREEAILETLSEKDREEFISICDLLDFIIETIGEVSLALNAYDYRKTFKVLKNVIMNKRWLQKTEPQKGAFQIGTSGESFFRNRANVIRALALGESDVYFSEYSLIPNLLKNNAVGGDLWVLIVMKEILKHHSDYKWRNSFSINDLQAEFDQIFPDEEKYRKDIVNAIHYLIINRLLLRGMHQEQRDSVDLDNIDLSTIDKVYPSEAIRNLWDSLGENSILFEIFIDDIYIDSPIRTGEKSETEFKQFNIYAFRECINVLHKLIEEELRIRRHTLNYGTYQLYIQMFGSEPVTKQLQKGLRKSLKTYFKNDTVSDTVKELSKSLNEIDDEISNVVKVNFTK